MDGRQPLEQTTSCVGTFCVRRSGFASLLIFGRLGAIMLSRQFSDLPRAQKLRLLRKIAFAALANYDIEVAKVRFFAEHSNVLYSVQSADGQRYLLKIARPGDHSLAEIRSSLWWLRDANLAGIRNLLYVVPARKGRLVVTVGDDLVGDPRYCSVYRWVPGRNLERSVGPRLARKWGELSASLHRFSDGYVPRPETDLMTWDKVFYWDEAVLFSDKYSNYIDNPTREVFHRAADKIQRSMDILYAGDQRPILIHADLHPDNIKVHKRQLYALDTEDLMWGFPQQDIAISLLYVRHRPDFELLLNSFRQGYTSLRAWPVNDPDELATYFTARLLMFANFVLKLPDFEADFGETLARYAESCKQYLERSSHG
jgi:Ser/Thr protein kinase RdoA (MazF antagonist)